MDMNNNFENINELFSNFTEETIYWEHDDLGDNGSCMREFLSVVNLNRKYIFCDDDTLVYIYHPNFDFFITLSIQGGGDFFNSIIEVEKIKISSYFNPYPMSEADKEVIRSIGEYHSN